MLGELLNNMKKYSKICRGLSSETEILNKIISEYSSETKCSIIFIDNFGKFIFDKIRKEHFSLDNKSFVSSKNIDPQLNEQIRNIVETKTGLDNNDLTIKLIDKNISNKFKFSIVPITCIGNRIGTLILYREKKELSQVEMVELEYISTLVAVFYTHIENKKNDEINRKRDIVKSAMGTLSYSELEAVIHIFEELKNNEGLLVASKVADKVGITRSVIVNALRKFESAGIIESRSLGMKGTYIKILNEFLNDEIKKLKK